MNKITKICPVCGKKFRTLAYRPKRYCSKKCKIEGEYSSKIKGGVIKICPICGKQFTTIAHRKYCSLRCRREAQKIYRKKQRLKKEQEYQKKLAEQNGVCAICGERPKKTRRLAFDHDHKTGKMRGLLCGRCNMVLGSINEDTEILKKMIAYLEKWNGKSSRA